MLTDASPPPPPALYSLHPTTASAAPNYDHDASTAASSPSGTSIPAIDDPTLDDDPAGVSPEVPPTVADGDHHDSPAHVKGGGYDDYHHHSHHIVLEVDNGGLEPKPELATEPVDDGSPMEEQHEFMDERLQEAEDAMDIDTGIVVEDVSVERDPSPLPQVDNATQPDAPLPPAPQPGVLSPALSNNTMPSTLDQMQLSQQSRSPSRSHSPAVATPVIPDTSSMAVDTIAPSTSTASLSRPYPEDDASVREEERPSKRQRNAYDEPSVSPSSSRAPLASAPSPTSTPSSSNAVFSPAQLKFAIGTIKTLKRAPDSVPFRVPVDPVVLQIPHYPNVIQHPMDLGTIERKLNATKKGAQADTVGVYNSPSEFSADVRLVWENAYTFNGRPHLVSSMAERLSEIFERQIKQMPPAEDIKPFVAPTPRPAPIVTNVAAAPPTKKTPTVRRPSTSTPVIRRSDHSPVDTSHLNVNTRPKREIHAPPPKDSAYGDAVVSGGPSLKANGYSNGVTKKHRGNREGRDDGTAEQLNFCKRLLAQLFAKQHNTWLFYFYDPVDATFVPNYYQRIRKPMDLSTMRRKLDQGEYPNAQRFYQDLNQIYTNCMEFNPTGVVREAGIKFKQLFDEKWAGLPPLKSFDSDDESVDETDGESDLERERLIRSLEDQVANLNKSIDSLRASQREKRKRRERAREDRQAARYAAKASSASHRDRDQYDPPYGSKPVAAAKKGRTSSISSAPKANGAATASSSKTHHHHKQAKAGGKKSKAEPAAASAVADEDAYDELDSALDNVQKKELSEAIEKLEGLKLEKVINIIQEGVPGIGNNSEEIELEIDALPSIVLQRLYNFVVRPLKVGSKPVNAYKVPKRTGSGNTGRTGAAATGGVKRKSMDERAEAEKIRSLEEKARLLAGGAPAAPVSQGMGNGADEDDSVQSSEESGSESESESD